MKKISDDGLAEDTARQEAGREAGRLRSGRARWPKI